MNVSAAPISTRRISFILTLMVVGLFSAWRQSANSQPASELYRITAGVTRSQMNFHQVEVAKGQEHVLADFKGPGKVTYFYITDDTVGKWYPGLVLKVYWDEKPYPCIQMPLADFFGAIAGKAVDYPSALLQINHACFMSYLPMPFSKRARFVLANDGDRDYSQKVAYGIDVEENATYTKEQSRLHCEWRRSNPVTNGLHTILATQGRGQYVGSILQTVSKSPGVWFGEGDTIFHLDGKAVDHTPGTEDEYGSCWEDPHWRTFASPYCGHVLNENGVNRMYRWYVANPVRFQRSLKVEIQNQHNNGTPTTSDADDYTSVAFWYLEGPHEVYPLPAFKDRTASSFSGGKQAVGLCGLIGGSNALLSAPNKKPLSLTLPLPDCIIASRAENLQALRRDEINHAEGKELALASGVPGGRAGVFLAKPNPRPSTVAPTD